MGISLFAEQKRIQHTKPGLYEVPAEKVMYDRSEAEHVLYRTAVSQYNDLFSRPHVEPSRRDFSVVMVSGTPGIGKSAVGFQAPHMLRRMANAEKSESFQKDQQEQVTLRDVLRDRLCYIHIEMNGAGDDYDPMLDPRLGRASALGIRLLARAMGLSLSEWLGFATRQDALRDHPVQDSAVKRLAVRSRWEECDDAKALCAGNVQDVHVPHPHEVIEAIAEDFRKMKSLQPDSRIAILVVVDEHQLYYDAFSKCNETDRLVCHKEMFYPLMTFQFDGQTSRSRDLNIFLLPYFVGTAHDVLAGMIGPVGYNPELVPISPVSTRSPPSHPNNTAASVASRSLLHSSIRNNSCRPRVLHDFSVCVSRTICAPSGYAEGSVAHHENP